jgi:3-oxoacyl-[acyl-carrier protein] reductase
VTADSSIAGKRALVTGASRGIGRSIAETLSAAGVAVAINYHERVDAAERLRSDLETRGGLAITVRADVSRASEVNRMVAEVRDGLGGIDILINNAGIGTRIPIESLTEADWEAVIDANLTSAFLVTQAVIPEMRSRRWGRLVFMSSTAAQVGGVIGPHYAASKAGLSGLMHYYAAHLAKEGVTANAISPALIETEMVTANPGARPEMIPVCRFGRVEEVASAVLMLVQNAYITGQTLQVNGGLYLT